MAAAVGFTAFVEVAAEVVESPHLVGAATICQREGGAGVLVVVVAVRQLVA